MRISRTPHVWMWAFLCALVGGTCASSVADEDRSLEPLYAFVRGHDYHRAVYDTLVGDGEEHWMIVLPSFRPEYAIVLKARPADPVTKKRAQYLEVVRAQSAIYGYEHGGDGSMRVRYDTSVPMTRVAKDISEQDVVLFAEANLAVFRRLRIPAQPKMGFDGIRYLFCFDRFSATTWSPNQGDGRALLNVWNAAIDFVEASGRAEEAALSRFRSACATLKASPAPSGE